MAEPGRRDITSIGLPTGEIHRGGKIGKYEILTQLSLGGMAELFLAFTAGPGGFRKYVVVKRILPDVRAQEQFVKMFLDEARTTAGFSHPNIAQVFDLGDQDGLFIAMEFVAGQNLNQITSACSKRGNAVPIGFTCAMARDVCLALHYAHNYVNPTGRASQVIHRDVAQKNIMVAYDGTTKLLDFGIAKAKGNLGRTTVGMVKGTTGYMSPEQVRAEALDGRSDLFAVGVVMHEMLTGERLFSAETETEEMTRILDAPIPVPHEVDPKIPIEISDVVMKALSRDRTRRYASGKEMARALERAAGSMLFDQDRMATFMRELFSRKMEATRVMLESAQSSDEQLHEVTRTLNEESGPFNAKVRAARSAPKPSKTPPSADVTARAKKRVWSPSMPQLLALGGAFALAAVLLVFLLKPKQPTPLNTAEQPTLVLQPLTSEPAEGAARQPPIPAGKPVEREPVRESREASREREPAREVVRERESETPSRRVGKGSLTLVTVPSARVFLSGRELGRTPILKMDMPAKTHTLKLLGPDGRMRVLSAPIRAGKTATFRLKLDELPLAISQ